MSTHKYIDTVCIVITVFTLVLTVLFMNGSAFGIKAIEVDDGENSLFSKTDTELSDFENNTTNIILKDNAAEINGNGAYFSNGNIYIVYAGKYKVSGELKNGSITVDADGDDKVFILFNGVDLTNEKGPALIIEQADKVVLTLADNSENHISNGERDSKNTDYDGAVFSKDDLTVNGKGSLTVTGNYSHGIVCNDDLKILDANLSITALDDAIHAHDSVRIKNANIEISAGDDGIHAVNDERTSFIDIESGEILINKCYEGIESKDITVNGGKITIYPTDDGLNANDNESKITVNGGEISVINENGRDADGFDSNGDIEFNGGYVYINVNGDNGSYALDCGSENGGKCIVNGGTVIALGDSAMAEGFSKESGQGYIMTQLSGIGGETLTVTDSENNVIIEKSVNFNYSHIVLSSAEITNGQSYTLKSGDTSVEVISGGYELGGEFSEGTFDAGNNMNGGFNGGQNGKPPEMPQGGFNGENSGMPKGQPGDMTENSAPPEMPEGETPFTDEKAPQMPENKDDINNSNNIENKNPDKQTEKAKSDITTVSSSQDIKSLIFIVISVLVLCAGLLFAYKFKY